MTIRPAATDSPALASIAVALVGPAAKELNAATTATVNVAIAANLIAWLFVFIMGLVFDGRSITFRRACHIPLEWYAT